VYRVKHLRGVRFQLAKKIGIDNGMFTNGVLLDKKKADILANNLCWIRFNIGGADRKSYSRIHGVTPDIFDLVYRNVEYFTKINKEKISCGIGIAINQDSFDDSKRLPYLAAQLKLEYFQGKLEFFQTGSDKYAEWWRTTVMPYFEKVEKELRGKIKIHIFSDPITRTTKVTYCHAHRLINAITADGRVAFCKIRRQQKGTSLGNIYESSLKEIFDSARHRSIANKISPKTCSILNSSFCPYRTTNEFIEKLREINNSIKSEHRNFF